MAVTLAYYDTLPEGEAGLDEAGRGCLAGPVVAAAVMLDGKMPIAGLNDSKKLSSRQRELCAEEIKAKAIAWAIGEATVEEIGQLNILHASILAMHRAVMALSIAPKRLLVDGNRFTPLPGYAHVCHVKGDGRFAAIAAASILAKTHRDAHMSQLSAIYPEYGYYKHFGYPTRRHRAAIAEHGPCDLHRPGFKLL
jgi:ribonuclease HII